MAAHQCCLRVGRCCWHRVARRSSRPSWCSPPWSTRTTRQRQGSRAITVSHSAYAALLRTPQSGCAPPARPRHCAWQRAQIHQYGEWNYAGDLHRLAENLNGMLVDSLEWCVPCATAGGSATRAPAPAGPSLGVAWGAHRSSLWQSCSCMAGTLRSCALTLRAACSLGNFPREMRWKPLPVTFPGDRHLADLTACSASPLHRCAQVGRAGLLGRRGAAARGAPSPAQPQRPGQRAAAQLHARGQRARHGGPHRPGRRVGQARGRRRQRQWRGARAAGAGGGGARRGAGAWTSSCGGGAPGAIAAAAPAACWVCAPRICTRGVELLAHRGALLPRTVHQPTNVGRRRW